MAFSRIVYIVYTSLKVAIKNTQIWQRVANKEIEKFPN